MSQGSHVLSTGTLGSILKGPEPEGPYLPVSKVEAEVIGLRPITCHLDRPRSLR